VRIPPNAHVLTELKVNSRIVGNPSVTRPNGQRVRCGLTVIRKFGFVSVAGAFGERLGD
jgi:hypothetical protein